MSAFAQAQLTLHSGFHWSTFPPAVHKDSYSPYDTPRGCCLVLQFVSLKGVSGLFHSTPLKTDESEYLFTSLLAF